jgi:tetratricopeptide (TPR) repeat protein
LKAFSKILYLSLLLTISIYSSGYSSVADNELSRMILAGKRAIYNFDLDSALTVFRDIQKKYPDLPQGYFYEAYLTTVYFSQDKSNNRIDSSLHVTVDKSIKLSEAYRKEVGDTPEAMYYLGVSHGLMGIYHAINKNYFNGYIHGRKGKNYLQDAVKLDSTYYDAYLGLGIFHYYVDLLPGIIKFFAKILGFEGNREKGIHEILLTAHKGRYFRVEAEFAYAGIRYFLEGEQAEGFTIFRKLKHEFPHNPAVTLLIGYHYRRNGQVKPAITYFSQVPDLYSETLPQITVMKYYNLGVCYFRLNDFDQAEPYFNKLLDSNLRKTRFYQAALAYYEGLLGAINGDQKIAKYYLRMIYDNKDMEYWYNCSRMFVDHPIDSVAIQYVQAENDIFTANFDPAQREVTKLLALLKKKPDSIENKDLVYLIFDLDARLNFRQGKVEQAKEVYDKFSHQMPDIKDEFQRAWVYIGYARVLREVKQLQKSEELLSKAGEVNDEYTRLIVERELYIIKHLKRQGKA